MVRRAFPAALRRLPLFLLPVLLAGCGFFTASLFPGYLAQAEMSLDLSPNIDDFLSGQDYRWSSRLFVLRSPAGSDYCALLIELDNLPQKKLILVDPSGNLKELSNPSLGRLNLLDAAGDFVVGSMSFPPDTLSDAVNRGLDNYSQGFSNGSFNYLLWSDGGSTINQLAYQDYDSTWSPVSGTPYYANIREAQSGFELRSLFYDSAASGEEVVLVFYNFMTSLTSVYFLPVTGFGGTLPVSPDSLLALYPPLVLDNESGGDALYTQKGIVVSGSRGRTVLLDFTGADTGKGLDQGQRGEVRLAFDLEGDNFYAFSPENRMLFWGKTGW